jgi:hypothetical protein
MRPKGIRIAARILGTNTMLTDGFVLRTLPGGRYGIRWRRSPGGHVETNFWFPWEPGGLGTTDYWFAWEPPQEPVRIEFERHEYIFCAEMAREEDIKRARRVTFQQMQEGR